MAFISALFIHHRVYVNALPEDLPVTYERADIIASHPTTNPKVSIHLIPSILDAFITVFYFLF